MIEIILLLVLAITAICTFYFGFYRNHKVCDFRINLIDRGYSVCKKHLDSIPDEEFTEDKRKEHEHLRDMWHSITDMSYDKMLYSFKPLKEECWLTKEQIEFLHKYDQEDKRENI